MINLLPYDLKKQTVAARINTILFRYIVILIIAIGFVTLTFSAAYMFLSTKKANDLEQLDTKKTVKATDSSTQGQANKFISDLAIVKNILDRQLSYADIITSLGNTLPQGSIIDSLSLNDSSLGSPINLKIRATSSTLESKIKESFATSTIFSGYRMISNTEEAGLEGYPVVINVSVTVNRAITR